MSNLWIKYFDQNLIKLGHSALYQWLFLWFQNNQYHNIPSEVAALEIIPYLYTQKNNWRIFRVSSISNIQYNKN